MSRRPSCRFPIAIVAFSLALSRSLCADSAVPIDSAQQTFTDYERRYSVAPQVPQAYPVQQTAFVGTTVAKLPPTAASPNENAPAYYPTTVIPPASGASPYPSPVAPTPVFDAPPSDDWCLPPTAPARTSSWTAAIELIPSETHLTDFEFGPWNDNDAFALRFILGYEDPAGVGFRGRFWGLAQEFSHPIEDVTLTMNVGTLEVYKRLFLDGAEVAFGGGGAGGNLEFEVTDELHSRFEGGGGTAFVDGYYTLSKFSKSELGSVVRARYTMLTGDWRDTTGGILIPRSDNDTVAIVEIAWGLEYRRRFGPCEDHLWFLGALWEYQRWQSDLLSNASVTSIGITGLNIYTGISW